MASQRSLTVSRLYQRPADEVVGDIILSGIMMSMIRLIDLVIIMCIGVTSDDCGRGPERLSARAGRRRGAGHALVAVGVQG